MTECRQVKHAVPFHPLLKGEVLRLEMDGFVIVISIGSSYECEGSLPPAVTQKYLAWKD